MINILCRHTEQEVIILLATTPSLHQLSFANDLNPIKAVLTGVTHCDAMTL